MGERKLTVREVTDYPSDFGRVILLYLKSSIHKTCTFDYIQRAIIPAMHLGQCLMIFDEKKLVGYISWAKVDDETLDNFILKREKLPVNKRDNGDHFLILDFLAPYGNTREIVHKFRNILKLMGVKKAISVRSYTDRPSIIRPIFISK